MYARSRPGGGNDQFNGLELDWQRFIFPSRSCGALVKLQRFRSGISLRGYQLCRRCQWSVCLLWRRLAPLCLPTPCSIFIATNVIGWRILTKSVSRQFPFGLMQKQFPFSTKIFEIRMIWILWIHVISYILVDMVLWHWTARASFGS